MRERPSGSVPPPIARDLTGSSPALSSFVKRTPTADPACFSTPPCIDPRTLRRLYDVDRIAQNRPYRDVSAAVQPLVHVSGCKPDRALSPHARHQRLLCVVVPQSDTR